MNCRWRFLFLPMMFLFASPAFTSPQLTVDGSATHDFGVFPANQQQHTVFHLSNAGDAPVTIVNIHSNCGCVAAVPGRQTLAPGEKTELKAVLQANSVKGTFDKKIFIQTNSPSNSLLRLSLRGDSRPLFSILPAENFFAGYLPPSQAWQQDFVLRQEQSGMPIQWGQPQVQTSSSSSPVSAVMATDAKKGNILHVTAMPKEHFNLNCRITVPVLTPGGWPPATIEIRGFFGYALRAEPGRMLVPVKSQGEFVRKVILTITGTDKLIPERLKFPIYRGIDFRVLGSNGNRAELQMTFDPAVLTIPDSGLTLKIEYPDSRPAEMVFVPVRFLTF